MKSSAFTESIVELAALTWRAFLGYTVLDGLSIAPDSLLAERQDYDQVLLSERLRQSLARLNPGLPPTALTDAFRKLSHLDAHSLEARDHLFHRLLVEGVTVEFPRSDGSIAGAQARLLDYDDPENNDWLAVNQFTVVENKFNRRPDMVIFVNGLPLAVIELKNAADENAHDLDGLQPAPDLQAAHPLALRLQRSPGHLRRPRSSHRHPDRPTKNGSCPGGPSAAKTLASNLLSELEVAARRHLRDNGASWTWIRHFIVFEDNGGGLLVKKMAGYHQFHAVNVALKETSAPRSRQRHASTIDGRYLSRTPERRRSPATSASASSGTPRAPARA